MTPACSCSILGADKERFLESLRVQRAAEATVKLRAASLAIFAGYLEQAGIGDARAVTRHLFRDYQQWLSRQAYAPWTQVTHLQAVRGFFRFLEKTDAVLVNPCDGVLLPRLGVRLPRRVLTKAEARRLLALPDVATPRGLRDRALLEMFYSTGLRLAEMTALRVQDVDVKSGFVRTKGKGGRERIVPTGASACAALRDYLQRARQPWCRHSGALHDALWLDSKKPHQPLRKGTVAVTVQKYGRQIGLALSPHVWRHTCATHLVSGGANIAYVQRQLGHRSLRTTQVYTRVSVPDLRRMLAAKHPRERSARRLQP